MDVLIGIDGATSLSLDSSSGGYAGRYRNSFVNRVLSRVCPGTRKIYFNGPSATVPGNLWNRASTIHSTIVSMTRQEDAIHLVGYSLGAATCVLVANLLGGYPGGYPSRFVVSISLFDAVANSIGYFVSHIYTYYLFHARRSVDISNPLYPRLSFSNQMVHDWGPEIFSVSQGLSPGIYRFWQREFPGNHGDLGGHLPDTSPGGELAYACIAVELAAKTGIIV